MSFMNIKYFILHTQYTVQCTSTFLSAIFINLKHQKSSGAGKRKGTQPASPQYTGVGPVA